ncbi:MAG: DNA gyrase subunit A [Candidatus Glassbacteria bacterium]
MAIEGRERILPRYIEEEMRDSYIDYSMSVIVGRALPDVRDGLKPVHRRILFAMNGLGLLPNRPYKKSASVVGEVLAKYHPHGDAAVYDTLVRMVQDFSLRYTLVDGQGNFGSIDGDSPAAYRYTEARLNSLAMEMIADIEKDTVDFGPNFDDSLKEPLVLPSKLPNLLVNGSSGIAVGMATNMPPHNLGEIVDGLICLIENPDSTVEELMEHIQGPDFPTGAYICGRSGIDEAYRTGKGKLILRARANIESRADGRESIVITEIPYMVNKTKLIEQVAALVREKKVEGIVDLRDESDKEGMRIVIDVKRDVNPQVIMNQLYKKTNMQETFGIINLALVDQVPKILNLQEVLGHYIEHRHRVITRRTEYDLGVAEKRAHILEGLKVATSNIDAIVQLIKRAKDTQTAKTQLMKRFRLTDLQAQAILDMRLARLTGLERRKIDEEYKELLKTISYLKGILESKRRRMALLKEELIEIKKKYADERRTEIIAEVGEFSLEDIIAEEEMLITISRSGYIKRLPVGTYRRQQRGGRGITGMGTRESDFVEHLFIASTHDYILVFTNNGQCYWLKVHEIPQAGRAAMGKAIVNLINLRPGEAITGFQPVRGFEEDRFITMVTKKGLIKKTSLGEFSNPRKVGIKAMAVEEGDELIEAVLTDGSQDIILATKDGMAIRFPESQIREMGRSARGVRGITLRKNDELVSMVAPGRATKLLVATEGGYGKRTRIEDYRVTNRAGKGIITLKVTERTGRLVAVKEVLDEDEIMLISQSGMVIRQRVSDIKVIGRATQGVKLIQLEEGDRMVDVARVMQEEHN